MRQTASHSVEISQASSVPAPLPETWRRVHLGDICEIQLGKMLSPKSKTGKQSRPYLRNTNVQWNHVDLSDIAEMDFTEKEEKKFALRDGDLLVCEGGEPGRAAVWRRQIQPCYYQKALHRLRPLNSEVDTKFIMYRLWMGALQGEFTDSQAKTTIAHLPAVRLSNLLIALPSHSEQSRIVETLDERITAIEQARAAAEAQLKAARDLPASYLHQVFESVDARQWREVKLGEVCKVQGGFAFKSEDYKTFGNAVIRISNIVNGTVEINEGTAYVPDAVVSNLEQYKLRSGDVLLAMSGATTGKIGVVPEVIPPCYLNQRVGRFKPDEYQLDSTYLQFFLTQPGYLTQIFENAFGAAIPNVSPGFIESLSIRLPSIEEQRLIAQETKRKTKAVGYMYELLQEQLKSINALTSALLLEAFTGKL